MSEGNYYVQTDEHGDDFSLVPQDIESSTNIPFIDLLLVALGYSPYYGLSADQAVRAFVRAQAGMYDQVRAVSSVVGQAGVRVRDSGQLRNGFDDNLKYYTHDEMWCFDLAIDMLAMLATLPGVSGAVRFRAQDAVRDLNETCQGHWFHKQVRHAVDAPAAFAPLRSRVPVRSAKQARSAGGPGYM
jgi:hypothetical protein